MFPDSNLIIISITPLKLIPRRGGCDKQRDDGGDPDGVAGDGPGDDGLEGGQTQDGRQLHGRRAG